jgi:hypothetical protein
LGDNSAEEKLSPPQGTVKSYIKLLNLLESRSVSKVDKKFLEDLKMAKGNEGKLIAGLKFLGLIDQDRNAREAMNNLNMKGETRKENLEKIVRNAYSLLFEETKFDFETADADTLVNSFKSEYKMGSLITAERAARIFVFLAQQAGIKLSEDITQNLSVTLERRKTNKQTDVRKKKKKGESLSPGGHRENEVTIPEEAVAQIYVKGVGNAYVKDKDTYELAKQYMKLLAKKLGIPEE